MKEKKSLSDACEALHIIKREHGKVCYGRIINYSAVINKLKLVPDVWVTWDVKKC